MTPVIDFLPSSPSRCAGLPVGLPRKKPKKALHKAVVTSGDALDRLATRLEPPFRQAFLNATAALRGHPDLDRLEDALASGASVDDALAVAFSGYQMDLAPAVAALRTAFSQGGHLAAGMLADNIGLSVGFNLRNPRAENWARTAGSTLITQVTNASKDAIRDIVADGMEAGHHPRVMARAIRDFIGLTAPQRSSLANYGAELEAEGLTEDVINKRLERRIDRNIRDRAVVIARTESIRAVHEGQREAWDQAADAGLLDRDETEKKWIVTEDERLCPFCEPLDGVTVGLDEEFETDLGPVDGPPLHIQCRCAQGLVFPDREETKHYGPGEHPSGSPQDVHGGDGAAEDADEAELRVWRAKRDEAKGVIDKGIAEWSQAWRETPLSPAQQQEYREAAHKVIDWMPRGSLDRFMATIQRVNFMPSMEAVRDYYDKTVVGGDSRGMGGFARVSRNINTGVERASVTIDGGYEGGNPRGIYAHEFAHVVDGHTSRSVSGTPEWNSAWHSEIGGERRLLSEYAATSQREGFAEFGRLVYTSPREARDMFPESWAVWKKHGLL